MASASSQSGGLVKGWLTWQKSTVLSGWFSTPLTSSMFFQQVFHFSLLDWQKAVLSFGPILLFIFNTSIGFHRPQACFHRQPFIYTLLTGSFMKASLEIDLRTVGFWLLGKRDTTGIWYFRHFFFLHSFVYFFFWETTSILSLYSLSSLFCFNSITHKTCFSAGWRDDGEEQGSYKGPDLSSLHPRWWLTTTCDSNSRESDDSGLHSHKQRHTNTCTHTIKDKIIFRKKELPFLMAFIFVSMYWFLFSWYFFNLP